MSRRILLSLVLLLTIAILFVAWFGGDGEPVADAPLEVQVKRAAKADRAAAKLIDEAGLVEDAAEAVNDLIQLPDRITVVFGGDPEGPYYDPNTRRIEYPWEFVTETRPLLAADGYRGEELDVAVADATRFILYHELGHALIDVLELPVLGREEDAADGFAAWMSVEHDEDGALVIAATDLFAAFDEQAGDELEADDFFDSHSLDLQRFYAISCLVYGADTDAYADVIDGLGIDEYRQEECPAEWEQLAAGWEQVLEPHLQ